VRVLLDVSAVPEQLTGAGIYTTELARALDRRHGLDLVLVARTRDAKRWHDVAPRADVRALAPRARPTRLLWEQLAGPRAAAQLSVDVWHGPHYTMPWRVGVPTVVTVHDLTFFDHPEWHQRSKVMYFRRAIAAAAKRAAVMVCVSDATAARLRDVAPPTGDLIVVHHGVDTARFTPSASEDDDLARLAALGVAPPFIAFVGTIEPRKNIPALVAAFATLANDHPDLRLVLAGKRGWHTQAIDDAIERTHLGHRILQTGYVPDDALPPLLRRAEAFVYPSHEEGFGIPPLEAMACGAPVLTTPAVATAELLGDAVVTTEVDAPALAEGLRTVLEPATQAKLRAAGPPAAARHTWSAAAERHIAAYVAAGDRALYRERSRGR
jgi:glycosyltransferase involved in cell wall biosynthesis